MECSGVASIAQLGGAKVGPRSLMVGSQIFVRWRFVCKICYYILCPRVESRTLLYGEHMMSLIILNVAYFREFSKDKNILKIS